MLKKTIRSQFIRGTIRSLGRFQFADVWHSLHLRYRYIKFKKELERLGVSCELKQQYRDNKTAHIWSTAYQIVNGSITMDDLRKLTKGRDRDGTLWYKREWDNGGEDFEAANKSVYILENAKSKAAPNCSYAEEGYPPNSGYRLPNLETIPVSKHVNGLAIDIDVDWEKLEGAWSQTSENLITSFGLKRTKEDEEWHVELLL